MVLKIIKHCQEALPSFVTGQLLGLDIGRTLEVTNCFPFPNKNEEAAAPPAGTAEEDGDEDGAEYQMHMMQCLREVNVDNNTVGWYQSTYFSSFIDDSCIDTQFNYQVRRAAEDGRGWQRGAPKAARHARTHARMHARARLVTPTRCRTSAASRGGRAAEHQILLHATRTRMPHACHTHATHMPRAGEHQELRGDHLRPLAHTHDGPGPARLPADGRLHGTLQGDNLPNPNLSLNSNPNPSPNSNPNPNTPTPNPNLNPNPSPNSNPNSNATAFGQGI